MPRAIRQRPGLARIDVLVLVTLIACVLGLAMPAVLRAQNVNDRQVTLNRLKQLGIAYHTFAGDYKKLPVGAGKLGALEGTHLFFLLPYLEQKNVFDNGKLDAVVEVYLSPLDPDFNTNQLNNKGVTNFVGNERLFPAKGPGLRFPAAFDPAGTSNVVMVTTVVRRVDDKSGHCWGAIDGKFVPLLTNFELPTTGKKGNEHAYQRAAMLDGKAAYVCVGDASVRAVTPEIAAKGTWGIVTNPKATTPPGANWND